MSLSPQGSCICEENRAKNKKTKKKPEVVGDSEETMSSRLGRTVGILTYRDRGSTRGLHWFQPGGISVLRDGQGTSSFFDQEAI